VFSLFAKKHPDCRERRPSKRRKGIFVDVGTFVNGADNRNTAFLWEHAVERVREHIGIRRSEYPDVFRSYIDMRSPNEVESAARLEMLGCETVCSLLRKNDSDQRLVADAQAFVFRNGGRADVAFLGGDADFAYMFKNLADEFGDETTLTVFCPEKSLSGLWRQRFGDDAVVPMEQFFVAAPPQTEKFVSCENSKVPESDLVDRTLLSSICSCIDRGKVPTRAMTARGVSSFRGIDERLLLERIRSLVEEGYLVEENCVSLNGNDMAGLRPTRKGIALASGESA